MKQSWYWLVTMCVCACLLPLAVRADGDENGGEDPDPQEPEVPRTEFVWTNSVSGGSWWDAGNWMDATNPPTGGDHWDVTVDFAELPPGAIVTFPSAQIGLKSLFFGSESNVVDGTSPWQLKPYNDKSKILLADEICVRNGRANLEVNFNNASTFLRKTGPGIFRINCDCETTAGITVEDGLLQLNIGDANGLNRGTIRFQTETNPVPLCLLTDATVGALEVTGTNLLPTIDLGSSTLFVGTKGDSVYPGYFTSNGMVQVNGGGSLTLTGIQTNAVTVGTLNGNLVLKRQLPLGIWRFEDASDIGKDSGILSNALVAVGSTPPSIETDSERGSVIRFNGANCLKGAEENGAIRKLPSGASNYSFAFWFKADADMDTACAIFGWGTFNDTGMTVGLRANGNTQWLFSNWGNNTSINCPYKDGAWHHLAASCTDGKTMFFLDGVWTATAGQATLNLLPQNFSIGKVIAGAWASKSGFKGLIDDVIVADFPFTPHQMRQLAADRIPAEWFDNSPALTADSTVRTDLNGSARIYQPQTVKAVDGDSPRGTIELLEDATLTVSNSEDSCREYIGGIAGTGTLRKEGTENNLVLSGRSTLTGTLEVAEGTLTLKNPMKPSPLAAYYKFDDASNPWKDSSANLMDLTEVGSGAMLATGLSGTAASFNGGSYLQSPANIPIPVGNDPYTVIFWVKDVASSGHTALFSYGSVPAVEPKVHGMRANHRTEIMYSHFGDNQNVTVPNLADGDWHQIASIYDQTNCYLYVDGVCRNQFRRTSELKVGQSPLYLGSTYWNSDTCACKMDEFAVYTCALSSNEVVSCYGKKTSYIHAQTKVVKLPEPVAYYAFDDAANPGKDSGPYGYDLASVNGRAKVVADSPVSGGMLSLRDGFDYLQPADATFPANLPTGNKPCTISLWVNAQGTSDDLWALVFWGETSQNCYLVGNARASFNHIRTFRFTPKASTDITNNRFNYRDETGDLSWHHVAIKYNPGSNACAIYVDGNEIAYKGIGPMNVPAQDFYVGMKPSSLAAQEYPKCLMDELRIYDTVLSNEQIRYLARQPFWGKGGDNLPESTRVAVADGAQLILNGSTQPLRDLDIDGTIRLADGALLLSGVTTNFPLTNKVTGVGDIGAANGANVTIDAAPALLEGGSRLVATNATLTIASADLGEASVFIDDGGVLKSAIPIQADVEFGNGARLDAADSLTVNGTVTLGASCEVDAHGQLGVFTLVTATTVPATDLTGWTIRNLPNPYVTAKVTVMDNKVICTVASPGTLLMIR